MHVIKIKVKESRDDIKKVAFISLNETFHF